MLAIDLDDDHRVASTQAVEGVEMYFKRSLSQRTYAASLSRAARAKIRPFGLNNPAIRPGTTLRILGARLFTGPTFRTFATDARQLLALPAPAAFECDPATPAEPLVFFQTRLWPAGDDDDVRSVNEERVALVRALRGAFGRRFIGGLIHAPPACEQFPDLLTDLPWSMRAYPALLRRPLITIYSRGLRNSIAFKLSEYLAASRCIVGQAPDSLLPQPLVAFSNYLPFENVDECIARCEQLISNADEAKEMRQNNWAYYRSQVAPAAHLQKVLEEGFRPCL